MKALWTSRKDELGLTQVEAAQRLGITQPSFSQYLNAIIPLNTDIVFKFAAMLQVNPLEIDPSLEKVSSLLTLQEVNLQQIKVSLIGSLTGTSIMGHASVIIDNLPHDSNYAGISVDNHELDALGIPIGSTLVLDLDKEPWVKNRHVAFRLRDENGYRFGQYVDTTPTGHRVKLGASAPRVLRNKDILAMHLVQSVQMP